jgi:hypothetical protein
MDSDAQTKQASRRGFLVWIGSAFIGTFAIPSRATDGSLQAGNQERKLIGPPIWSEDKEVMLWTENHGRQ